MTEDTPRDPDDPARYARLLALDPFAAKMAAEAPRALVEQWAWNHARAFGRPMPVPPALYDYYRELGGADAVKNMVAKGRTLF